MRTETKPNRENYYEYMFCYIDDLLCISHDTKKPMNDIQSTQKFKNNKVETPDFYIGSNLRKKNLGGKEVWTMSSTDYIKSSVENVE